MCIVQNRWHPPLQPKPPDRIGSNFSWKPFRRIVSGAPRRFLNFLLEVEIMSSLGSGPGRGRSPVEWGEIPSVRLFFRPSVHSTIRPSVRPPTGPLAGSQTPLAGPQSPPSGPQTSPTGPQTPPAGPQIPPASPHIPLARFGRASLSRWTDVQTDGIFFCFALYKTLFPSLPFDNQSKLRGK